MDSTTQKQIEFSAVLNLVPYLDRKFDLKDEMSICDIIDACEGKIKGEGHLLTFNTLRDAVKQNEEYYKGIKLVDQSSGNNDGEWTNDLIQACTFKDAEGNFYVSYRGTGNGRWPDNGAGMVDASTPMQDAAMKYFDDMAEKYLLDAKAAGKEIIVTGHSKGGNEAQYVYMQSKYESIIDRCYSIDGQGFSKIAQSNFVKRYGDSYQEKLSKMYSICGQNDYVHDLGHVIIPEENTYFVETTGNSFADLHLLEKMLIDKNGKYRGLPWAMKGDKIVNGEQGELGKLAKELSKEMMKLDSDDLRDAAIALMSLIDPYNNDEALGGVIPSNWQYLDMIADGVPVILKTLLFTEEGNAFLRKKVEEFITAIHKKHGAGGVVAAFMIGALVVGFLAISPIDDVILLALINAYKVVSIFDFAVDVAQKLGVMVGKVKDCILEIKNVVVSFFKKLFKKKKSPSAGTKYAEANPEFKVDTMVLKTYARSLEKLGKRTLTVLERIIALSKNTGNKDLKKLISNGSFLSIGYILQKDLDYLKDTASSFESVEQDLINKL